MLLSQVLRSETIYHDRQKPGNSRNLATTFISPPCLTCGDELEPAAEDHPERAKDDEVHDGRLFAVGHRRPPVLVAELEEPLEALPLLGQPGVDHLDI